MLRSAPQETAFCAWCPRWTVSSPSPPRLGARPWQALTGVPTSWSDADVTKTPRGNSRNIRRSSGAWATRVERAARGEGPIGTVMGRQRAGLHPSSAAATCEVGIATRVDGPSPQGSIRGGRGLGPRSLDGIGSSMGGGADRGTGHAQGQRCTGRPLLTSHSRPNPSPSPIPTASQHNTAPPFRTQPLHLAHGPSPWHMGPGKY